MAAQMVLTVASYPPSLARYLAKNFERFGLRQLPDDPETGNTVYQGDNLILKVSSKVSGPTTLYVLVVSPPDITPKKVAQILDAYKKLLSLWKGDEKMAVEIIYVYG